MSFSVVLRVRCVTEIWILSIDVVVAGALVSLQWAVVIGVRLSLFFFGRDLCFLEICR